MLTFVVMLGTAASPDAHAAPGIVVAVAPPVLPVYEQPVCPGPDSIWTPGYWAWADEYYWVPGTWVLAPEPGLLWTPPYWGWDGDHYAFYDGYWGPHIGFYGGISYGYGYYGTGFVGGRWDGGHFYYNRAVTNVNVTSVHNTYEMPVTHEEGSRFSYNGPNGVNARPTPQEEAYSHERHVPPVAAQARHIQDARRDPQLRASVNQGKPSIAATPRPGAFNDPGIVPARARERGPDPGRNPPAAQRAGEPRRDDEFRQQREGPQERQEQEHQNLEPGEDQNRGQHVHESRTPQREEATERLERKQSQPEHLKRKQHEKSQHRAK